MIHIFLCLYAVLIFIPSALPAQTPTPPPAAEPQKGIPNRVALSGRGLELVHMGDVVDVDILGSTEYDWRGTLDPEGFLDGGDYLEESIYGLCKSGDEIAAEIAKGYAKILRDPQVIVRIIDTSNRPKALLMGAVRTRQRFHLKRPVYLNELIIISGGITEKASGDIQILRSRKQNCEEAVDSVASVSSVAYDATGLKTLNIKVSDLLKGRKDANPMIQPGDLITLLEAEPVYVIGGVANPRRLDIRGGMTVTRAIASAGGLARFAKPRDVVLFRRENSETKIIQIDLEKIGAKQAEDIALKAFDILEVGQDGRAASKLPPVVRVLDESEKSSQELPLKVID